jgi:anti-sigma regulatory factor (Ser/Thr protein kinase)
VEMLAVRNAYPAETLLIPFAGVSVSVVRRLLALDLTRSGLSPDVVDDAVLIMSELLGNSLRHARPLPTGGLHVRWEVGFAELEVAVTDGGASTAPRALRGRTWSVGGRGLSIVETLGAAWGVHNRGIETTVWARLRW